MSIEWQVTPIGITRRFLAINFFLKVPKKGIKRTTIFSRNLLPQLLTSKCLPFSHQNAQKVFNTSFEPFFFEYTLQEFKIPLLHTILGPTNTLIFRAHPAKEQVTSNHSIAPQGKCNRCMYGYPLGLTPNSYSLWYFVRTQTTIRMSKIVIAVECAANKYIKYFKSYLCNERGDFLLDFNYNTIPILYNYIVLTHVVIGYDTIMASFDLRMVQYTKRPHVASWETSRIENSVFISPSPTFLPLELESISLKPHLRAFSSSLKVVAARLPPLTKVPQGHLGKVPAVVIKEAGSEIVEEVIKDHWFSVEYFLQVRLRPGCCVILHKQDGKHHFAGVGGELLGVGDSMEANLTNKCHGSHLRVGVGGRSVSRIWLGRSVFWPAVALRGLTGTGAGWLDAGEWLASQSAQGLAGLLKGGRERLGLGQRMQHGHYCSMTGASLATMGKVGRWRRGTNGRQAVRGRVGRTGWWKADGRGQVDRWEGGEVMWWMMANRGVFEGNRQGAVGGEVAGAAVRQRERDLEGTIANWGMYKGGEAEYNPLVGETPGKSQRERYNTIPIVYNDILSVRTYSNSFYSNKLTHVVIDDTIMTSFDVRMVKYTKGSPMDLQFFTLAYISTPGKFPPPTFRVSVSLKSPFMSFLYSCQLLFYNSSYKHSQAVTSVFRYQVRDLSLTSIELYQVERLISAFIEFEHIYIVAHCAQTLFPLVPSKTFSEGRKALMKINLHLCGLMKWYEVCIKIILFLRSVSGVDKGKVVEFWLNNYMSTALVTSLWGVHLIPANPETKVNVRYIHQDQSMITR
ncbi:hypothetical protein VP01_1009g2 [Puccinia sorghi]|uniref:Uncharacterized protein n=1 Tax=Puccinia sorghi TaxID=27349 RepID=A0A0L6VVG5_9BASI|nr:hypothetical protein VP01_1009g2 [Puccinia sorghi]